MSTTPRDLVCEGCWDGFFNTQAYQDFMALPEGGSDTQPRTIVQQTTSKHVHEHCSYLVKRRDIATSEAIPKPAGSGGESRTCNWCEYIGGYSCCELDEDGNAPEDDHDLLEITLKTARVDCSTPLTAPHAGAKVMMLSLARRDRKTGQSLVGNGCLHHAYTPADDPAAEFVLSRPVRSIVDDQEATKQIRLWVSECESHQCGKDGGFYKDTVLPTRVIDIGLDKSRPPRILETHGSNGVYATLSYCWGRQENVTLHHDNLGQFQEKIVIENLPRTIQDAITVTREMAIPYLWVDALCIVQDDQVEKAKEMARMQAIYSRSAVTIIASSASGADVGFLSLPEDATLNYQPRPPVVIPVRLAPETFGSMSFVDLNSYICYAEHEEPISRRAWTMQEQLLAQRKLIFTQHNHTMTWSCPHSPWTRAYGGAMHLPYWPGNFSGKEEDYLRETMNISALAPDPMIMSADDPADKMKALGCWLRLVTAYSIRSASLPVDKLNAIAGIAARCYAPLLGPGYFAGLWEYDLLRQLTWKTSDYHMTLRNSELPVTRPLLENGFGRAPSWSWASVEGGVVDYDRFPTVAADERDREKDEEEWLSEVISVDTTPRYGSDNPYGEIEPGAGHLILRTRLRRAWWHPPSHSIFRQSCAPTPSRSPTSSSDDLSDDESIAASSAKETMDVSEVESGSEIKNGPQTNADGEEAGEGEARPSEDEDGHRQWSDIPTLDLFTNRVTGGPVTDYVSPFKRVLRRTGPLPPDSDSEYDSETETGKMSPNPQQLAGIEDRDRTWWWLVNATLDEIADRGDDYSYNWAAQKDHEEDSVDPHVVYMLPLMAASRGYAGRKRSEKLVKGLLLVKDKVAMDRLPAPGKGCKTENSGKRKRNVLFRRIGSFGNCPMSEFEKRPLRDVTII